MRVCCTLCVYANTLSLSVTADMVFSEPLIELVKLLARFLWRLRKQSVEEVIFEEVALPKAPESQYFKKALAGSPETAGHLRTQTSRELVAL